MRYGRLYFRRIGLNGRDFGYSYGSGGLVAFSRILADREVLVVANTSQTQTFQGYVLVDADLNRRSHRYQLAHSNQGSAGDGTVTLIPGANLYDDSILTLTEDSAALHLTLAPMEVQIFTSHVAVSERVGEELVFAG